MAVTNLDELLAAVTSGTPLVYRFFWGHRAKPGAVTDACFSQWWPCHFTAMGETFTSAEQFMMAAKARLSGDEKTRVLIMETSAPDEVKALGRRVEGYDDASWARARLGVVVAGNLAKFQQNEELLTHLLSTRDDVLVEASPVDTLWGIGLARDDANAGNPAAWRGLNLLGFALMQVREELRMSAS